MIHYQKVRLYSLCRDGMEKNGDQSDQLNSHKKCNFLIA